MVVSVSHLTKTYGTQKAIDNLSFEVKPGEVLGFLGPNGAGKTTTMKVITCFMPPTSGTVSLGEYNIFDHPLEVRRLIGYLPEHNPLYPDMYVHEFLDFASRIYRIDPARRKSRIAEVIEMTGLGREQHKKIGMLSKGYRQRVGLAQALIHDPQVLILDEPTSGLDPNQLVDIRKLIREVGKSKTVIFSSHILSEVEAIADRAVIINRGRIVADESMQTLRNRAEGEVIVEAELTRAGFDFSVLETEPGFKTFRQVNENQFQLITEVGFDIREKLFWECARQENPLIGLAQQTFHLEDVFRRLTHPADPIRNEESR